MRTYEQRTADVLEKAKKLRTRRRVTKAVVTAVCLGMLALVLFLPLQPPSVRQYHSSPYYDLISKLNGIWNKPRYQNNFERLLQLWEQNRGEAMPPVPESPVASPDSDFATNGDEQYGQIAGKPQDTNVQITDDQVAGVLESDIIKRTNTHIYYLRQGSLHAYTIAQAQTDVVGVWSFADPGDTVYWNYQEQEMYLSQEGTCATILLPGVGDVITQGKKQQFVCVVSVDISDPQKMQETGRIYLAGNYSASRLVNGKLMLINNAYIHNCSFDQPEAFLPWYGLPGEIDYIEPADIIAPEDPSVARYVVVTMLEEKSLAVLDTMAMLSYSEESYVSRENIYLTRDFESSPDAPVSQRMTQIACIGYDAQGNLSYNGSVTLEGAVKNQYSMDEHNGILRVVTSTVKTKNEMQLSFGAPLQERQRNVNLYCISLEDLSVVAAVKGFAPEGEQAESVRFDGDAAYVCTAEVITLTDPVYYFDLSDLSNITWKDTGTIDGYSSSLVNFGDHLLGIGYNADRVLKIEIYRETETGVESVTAYERSCGFSEKYKSYFIDRKMQLIGLGITDYTGLMQAERYILLQFDGENLNVLVDEILGGANDVKRGVVIDGWLYLFGQEEFKAVQL